MSPSFIKINAVFHFLLATSVLSADSTQANAIPGSNTINEYVLLRNISQKDRQLWETVLGELVYTLHNLGVNTIISKQAYYVRDAKIPTADGKILVLNNLHDEKIGQKARDNFQIREQLFITNDAAFATRHRAFHNVTSGIWLEKPCFYKLISEGYLVKSQGKEYDRALGIDNIDEKIDIATSTIDFPAKYSRSFGEGGNFRLAKNKDGITKVIIGEASLTQTHQLLRLLGYFNNPDKKNKFYEHELRGKYSKLKDRANTLYRAGKIPEKVLELGQKFRPSAEEASNIFFEMVNIELIKNPHIKDHTSGMFALATGAYNNAIITYAGEKEFIKRILWPDEFGVKEEDIIVIPQAGYHLDTFMFADLDKIFLQDFGTTEIYLSGLLNLDKDFSIEEIALINSYIDDAALLRKDLSAIYARVEKILKDAGFTIIKTPGVFLGESQGKSKDLYFINGLLGFSTKTNRPYYICLGAQVGNKLGKVMMDDFAQFLKKHIENLDVHFIGQRNNDYSAAMYFYNEHGHTSGVHCMTYELKTRTKPH